jgi:uncharacterized membrane protein YjgN (DUF898 family)
MLKGSVLALIFFLALTKGSEMSPLAGAVAALAFVALAPALFRAAMRFRLANTSWRGIRFHFAGDTKAAYQSVGLLLALALLPAAVGGIFAATGAKAGVLRSFKLDALGLTMGAAYLVLVFGFPYLLWRIKRYQHANYAYGSLQMQFRCPPKDFYKVMLKAIGLALLGVILVPLLFGIVIGLSALLGKLVVVLIGVLYLLFVAFARGYWRVVMQNLVWSRTGNSQMRFVSELPLGGYVMLQLRNYLLILVTLGLYWPFAVVASRRMEIEAVTVRTRGTVLDSLVAQAQQESDGAVGDAAADLLDFDVGM